MLKKLTVVVPIHNGEKTVEALLSSLRSATSLGTQVIFVDDGSTDDTARILKRYPVKVIRLPQNYGIAYARNRGIEHVKTPYTAFVDADCVVEENWCEKAIETFEHLKRSSPLTAAISGRVLPASRSFTDLLAAHVEHWEYQGGNEIEERQKLSTSNCICDTAILLKVGKFDESLEVDEDRELGLRMVLKGYKIFYSPCFSVEHRHSRSSVKKILAHQYYWGETTGLLNEWKYRNLRGLWFLGWIAKPEIYLLIIPLLAFVLVLRIIRKTIRHDLRVLGLTPFLYLAKLCYRFGVYRWMKQKWIPKGDFTCLLRSASC